ncbi:MAG TPA: flagellar biosynthetic protein FliO [Erwinia sp.]|uniref:flagellar biosynthetic protein FliO n=1 Tax=Erwinia citreus TaxID=558 RepID=UPI000E8D9D59|nr:flagellar biosynthetic protein FliO [Erwinia sp.]HBV39349.1 flagellar biosynthetic protein FliO [Erwinia sp.]
MNTSQTQPQPAVHSPATAGQTQQPVGQPTVSTGSVLTQVSSVLAVIILMILACAWLAKRFGFAPKTGKRGQRDIVISATCQVGQRERVVIVDVQDARLVLGVTAQQITHLHTLPPSPVQENPEEPQPAGDFRQVFELIKRAGKPK